MFFANENNSRHIFSCFVFFRRSTPSPTYGKILVTEVDPEVGRFPDFIDSPPCTTSIQKTLLDHHISHTMCLAVLTNNHQRRSLDIFAPDVFWLTNISQTSLCSDRRTFSKLGGRIVSFVIKSQTKNGFDISSLGDSAPVQTFEITRL